MVRPLNLSLNPRVGLTYHLPVSFTANDAMNNPFRSPTAHHRRSSSQMTAVALSDNPLTPLPYDPHEQEIPSTPASSFPSIMSFQTLTNWWSPGSKSSSTASFDRAMKPAPVKYVSKEKQLEKLRGRLNQERRTTYLDHLQCKACGAGTISL